MKTLIFKLSDTAQVNRLMEYLKSNWRKAIKDGKPLIISVSEKDEDYTSKQRRLYFSWMTQFAKHQGDDQNSVHSDFKKRFLIAIYRRDDAGFNQMCESIAALKESEPEQYRAIAEGVIRLTSITKASKSQMSEYMNEIYHFCIKQNCYLQTPDDLRFVREMSDER